MGGSEKERKEAINRICSKLNVSFNQLMNMLDDFNKRVFELNSKTVEYAKNFLVPKGEIINNQIEYDLNDDDKSVLLGYKKRNHEILEKEFPQLFEVIDDLKIFEEKINPNLFK